VSLKLNIKKLYKAAQHRENIQKQSGGRGKFGDIVFRLEPADEVDGKVLLDYNVNAVKGGNVPKEYIPSVEKVLEKL
jgi:elongation factor G